jgi:uncharacterized protein
MPDLRFVLDAWALVAMLQGEEPAARDVRDLLQQAQSDDTIQLFVSVVNLGEVYYIISRARGDNEAQESIDDLKKQPLTLISATDERVMAAARFKAAHPVSYADAFAAATSLELEAILVTGDPELVQLKEHLRLQELVRTKR